MDKGGGLFTNAGSYGPAERLPFIVKITKFDKTFSPNPPDLRSNMVKKENLRFEVGDWVVHDFHGVGKIKDIVEKGLNGSEETFYEVQTKEIDYWIPLEEEYAEHIRPLRSKKDFENALQILSTEPEPIAQHHKTRKRFIHERWCDGHLASRAELLRDLNGRLKLKKLSFTEKETLEKVQHYFVNEWVIVDQSLTPKKAKRMIHKSLKKGVRKARKNQETSEE